MKKAFGLRGLGLVAAAFFTAAAPSLADHPFRDWQVISLSSSPRLKLRYLLEAKLPGSRSAVDKITQNLSLTPRKQRGGELAFSAMPILYYDENINDGIPSDTIMIIGLPFVVSEESRAKEGVVIGARAVANYNTALSHGLALEASIGIDVEHAPKWSYDKTLATSNVCLLYTTDHWASLDICATNIHKEAEGSEERRNLQSLRFGKVFSLPQAVYETSLTLQSQTLQGETQFSLTGGGTWFQPGGHLYTLSVGVGQEKTGVAFPVLTARMGIGTELSGKPTYFELGYLEERGGYFVGRERVDRSLSLRVRRPIAKGLVADVAARRKNSSISELSETTLELNFLISGLNL